MEFFEIIPKIKLLKIKLPSGDQQKKFDTCLQNFNGLTTLDLIKDLSSKLNAKSQEIVFTKLLTSDFRNELTLERESVADAISRVDYPLLPTESSSAIIAAHFKERRAEVESIFTHLEANTSSLLQGNGVASSTRDFVEQHGQSKVALFKALLAYLIAENTSKQERQELESLLAQSDAGADPRAIFFMSQCLLPKGRPFSFWTSQDEPFPLYSSSYLKHSIIMDGLCPYPISESHVPHYLSGLLGLSLPDQVAKFKALHDISKSRGWRTYREITKAIGSDLTSLFEKNPEKRIQRHLFDKVLGANATGFTIHTCSIAFPELSEASTFRNEADRLTLSRLSTIGEDLASPNQRQSSIEAKINQKQELERPEIEDKVLNFALRSHHKPDLPHVLRYLKYRESYPMDMSISGNALAMILATDAPYQCLASNSEIDSFIAQSEYERDYFGAMLWSSVRIGGRISDDADYSFLRSLERYVIEVSSGNIVDAFKDMGETHPEVAVSLVKSLPPRRLQKCYQLVSSYSEVNAIHRGLLEVAAKLTEDVDLIMQSDQILLDEKLASVRAHIDSSRIYVEEDLFHNWVTENVWPFLENIRKQIFLIIPGGRENMSTTEMASILKDRADVLSRITDVLQEIYLNDRLRTTYETFCTDPYFGVDSFLGRRIRHNATHGILLGQLDEVRDRISAQYQQDRWEIEGIYATWKRLYQGDIDELVNSKFRFKSHDHPRGLLSAEADLASEKFSMMVTDVIAQVITGSQKETILRAMTSGCWSVIDPELRKIRNFLKVDFTKSTIKLLDDQFFNSSLAGRAVHNELKATLLERIERLASWFSPYNPSETFISLQDLARLTWSETEDFGRDVELEILGNAKDAYVVGGQSRILYDCLHVLLVNAVRHRSSNKEVKLILETRNSELVGAHELNVKVTSPLSTEGWEPKNIDSKISNMKRILFTEKLSKRAMIIHGYSGLRKLRYLMYRMDREDQISLNHNGTSVSVGFSMPLEFAKVNDDEG